LFKERWKRPYGSWAVEVDLEFKDDRVLKYKMRASKAVKDAVRYMSMNEGVIFQLVILQMVVVVVCASAGLDVGYKYKTSTSIIFFHPAHSIVLRRTRKDGWSRHISYSRTKKSTSSPYSHGLNEHTLTLP